MQAGQRSGRDRAGGSDQSPALPGVKIEIILLNLSIF